MILAMIASLKEPYSEIYSLSMVPYSAIEQVKPTYQGSGALATGFHIP
jgi:hypothetical protein